MGMDTSPDDSEGPRLERLHLDEDEEMKVEEVAWDDCSTMDVPKGLPTEYEYTASMIYVRDCYSKYYVRVLEKLRMTDPGREVNVVSVTGAPGIGKSMFYLYFFRRYRVQNPHNIVITASYTKVDDKRTELDKVVVWRGGNCVEQADTTSEMEILLKKYRNESAKDAVLYLCDGTPRKRARGFKMVCFTSPSERWFEQNRKERSCKELIMPLWDVAELQTAAKMLNLEVCSSAESGQSVKVAELVEQRYYVFGGIARECLSIDAEFVDKSQTGIENIVKSFDKIDQVTKILTQTEGEKARHRILHYVPDPIDPTKYTIGEPPVYVKRLLIECWSRLVTTQRNDLINCMQGCPAAASFRGKLFEEGVHEKLHHGCELKARQLSVATETQPKLKKFVCKRSVQEKKDESYCYFDSDFSSMILESGGPYHIPRAKNFMSIDSFYFSSKAWRFSPKFWTLATSNRLLLFQITVARTHSVKGEGLRLVLERLGFLDRVKENPKLCALIFAVPQANTEGFVRQKIELELATNDDDDVRRIIGVGSTYEKALADAGIRLTVLTIRSIGDLRNFLQRHEELKTKVKDKVADGLSFGYLRKLLAAHDENNKPWLKATLESIPQFVWGAEVDPRYVCHRGIAA